MSTQERRPGLPANAVAAALEAKAVEQYAEAMADAARSWSVRSLAWIDAAQEALKAKAMEDGDATGNG